MVRPYLNKSDHEEFLAQYKLERNLRIRKYILIFTLVASIIGTGAYFMFGNSSSSVSNNLPAYIGGEDSKDLSNDSESGSKLIASAETEGVDEKEKQRSEKDFKALQQEKEKSNISNSAQQSTSSLGNTRGIDPTSETSPSGSTSSPAIVRVNDDPKDSNRPVIVDQTNRMTRNPELDTREDSPLFSAEKMPKFPGGYSALKRFIKTRLQIPKEAQKNKVDGIVQVQFIVNTEGAISNPRVSKGIGFGCDEAAIALVRNMPKWIPGEQDGETVAVYYNLPIKFSTK